MKIVLHLGLPKTATTFMQGELFPRLGPGVIYNPDDIFYFVNAIFALGIREPRFIDAAVRLAGAYAGRGDGKTLLLSSESFVQSGFDLNFEEHIGLLRRIFPHAEVVIFLRNQADWLASLYSESVKNGYHQGIEDFLGYRAGRFDDSTGRYNRNGMRHVNVWKCNWAELLACLRQAFGAGKVHLFFYEDFRAAPSAIAGKMLGILGCAPIGMDARPRVNRGLSAPAIALIVAYSRALASLGIRYPTYDKKYLREREQVLASPFHWRKRKRGLAYRALRALVMEPWRLLRRLEPGALVKRIDRRLPLKPAAAIGGEMRETLARIHAKQNARLEGEFGSAALRALYLPAMQPKPGRNAEP